MARRVQAVVGAMAEGRAGDSGLERGGDGEGKVGDLLFGEVGAGLGISLIGGVTVGDEGEGLGPGEGGALAVGVVGALAPGVEGVETLLTFAEGAEVLRVHVEAVGAAVDLGDAKFDKMK